MAAAAGVGRDAAAGGHVVAGDPDLANTQCPAPTAPSA